MIRTWLNSLGEQNISFFWGLIAICFSNTPVARFSFRRFYDYGYTLEVFTKLAISLNVGPDASRRELDDDALDYFEWLYDEETELDYLPWLNEKYADLD